MAQVSAADVARLAGVSGQTVSRVANGSPRVDPVTRARVESAMAALGYRPNRTARALRTGRTGTIGVVVRTLASVGNTRMLEAVTSAASAREHAVLVVTLSEADDRTAADAAFGALNDHGVDGAVVLNEATPTIHDAADPGFPVVAVDAATSERFTAISSDHAGGAALATAHLLSLGHAAVHHVAGPRGAFAADERERGWRAALADAGIAAPAPLRGDWTAATARRLGEALAADPAVTAVFAANDQTALGVLHAAHALGRDDLGVVGFDDVVDAADYWPPLTTVAQRFDELGAAAVDLLLARLDGRAVAARTVVPTRLVVRESARPVR
ncbi:LacI family DNA-binding transcriptional regulator [Microbacterium betulae]|uniref:LacI family DNA-binding transcriptional regulator n=1 Tax=Microbacterium betulae TaxID=2981139 RepID=A0AA97FI16_9MICO|nr:LacI family DNA-binding transcriptional regulator [Microbacterium sp. AB]WOF23058.1 LacI family DNA-binding transcriptional regulator [Microbacterium sp. AB]